MNNFTPNLFQLAILAHEMHVLKLLLTTSLELRSSYICLLTWKIDKCGKVCCLFCYDTSSDIGNRRFARSRLKERKVLLFVRDQCLAP
jgi:hypothetical protein